MGSIWNKIPDLPKKRDLKIEWSWKLLWIANGADGALFTLFTERPKIIECENLRPLTLRSDFREKVQCKQIFGCKDDLAL